MFQRENREGSFRGLVLRMADRHHYVSQFHLRWFIDPASSKTPDPWLWVGDREQLAIRRSAPKNVGFCRGLFDGPAGFANRDLPLEIFLANEVEAPAANVLRKWVALPQGKRGQVPPEVFRYITWAAARSLPMRQLYEDWVNSLPPNAKCAHPPPPGFETIKWGGGTHQMEHPTLGVRGDVPSEEVHALRAQGWQVRMGKADFLQVLHFQAWYFQVQMFPPLQWAVLDAPSGMHFIIGDRPVVWGVRQPTDKGWSMALNVPPYYLRDPHVQLVAPLTRSIALLALHASSPPPAMVTPDAINRIIASAAQRWIFGPTESTVRAAIDHRSPP
jgi:hypothetical protein